MVAGGVGGDDGGVDENRHPVGHRKDSRDSGKCCSFHCRPRLDRMIEVLAHTHTHREREKESERERETETETETEREREPDRARR